MSGGWVGVDDEILKGVLGWLRSGGVGRRWRNGVTVEWSYRGRSR